MKYHGTLVARGGMHVAQAPAHSAPDDCTDTPDTRINPRTDLPRINPRNDLRQCDVDNDVRRLLTTHFERTQRPLQVVLLNFVLAGWTGKDMRLRKHHLGQAANGHLELALLKSLLGAERANRTNMRLFGVGMVFSPPLGLPHPDRTESLQSLAEPLVAHMRSRMPCLYQALDEADIVISNGEGTLHADLSGTVPVNHTSYDAPCPSGHVLPACPGKPVADLLLALWLAKTHFNKTVWLRNTMWHIDPQADAWARAVAPALRSLDFISTRDLRSYDALLRLGVSADRLELTHDMTFALPPPLRSRRPYNPRVAKGSPTLLFCPTTKTGMAENYSSAFERAALALQQHVTERPPPPGGHLLPSLVTVVLFRQAGMHTFGRWPSATKLREGGIRVDTYTAEKTPSETLALFESVDAVVTGSFHCATFARLAATPAVGVSGNTPKVADQISMYDHAQYRYVPPCQLADDAAGGKAHLFHALKAALAARAPDAKAMAPGDLGRRGTPLDWFHQLALRNAEPCAASAAAEPDLSNDVQRAFLAKGRGVSLKSMQTGHRCKQGESLASMASSVKQG